MTGRAEPAAASGLPCRLRPGNPTCLRPGNPTWRGPGNSTCLRPGNPTWRGPAPQGAPRGITVIEVLMAFTILILVLGSVWNFYSQSRRSETALTSGMVAQQDLMLAMQQLTREVQEGVCIFYPSPASPTPQAGLGFISAKGRAIMFYLDSSSASASSGTTLASLVRLDLLSNERRRIARNVNYFKVKVEPPSEGKKVCLATVNLSLLRGQTDVQGRADDYNLVTKIFLRNVNMDLPDPE